MLHRRSVYSVLLLALLLGLSACGQEVSPQGESGPGEVGDVAVQEEEAPVPAVSEEDPSLGQLRQEMAQVGAVGGVAYLGTLPEAGQAALRPLLAQSRTAEQYPFLRDIPEQDIVFAEGWEVYCVVPARQTTLSVQDLNGSSLHGDTDAPLLLVCNQSQVEPNTQLTFRTEAGQTATLSPALGLCDGKLVLPASGQVYDFSRYDQDADQETASANASFLGEWKLETVVNDQPVQCRLTFAPDGNMEYCCGYPGTNVQDALRGTFYEIDSNAQYPAGSVLFELTFPSDNSPFWGVFTLVPQGDTLAVTHVSGEALLYGFEHQTLTFQTVSP